MIERLQRWATGQGYRVGWGPLDVITAALADVEARRIPAVLEAYTSESFSSERGESLRARGLVTVVVVVKPRPAHSVLFEIDGECLETLLPPTYFRYQNIFEEVREDLSARGLPGARVETLRAPLKQVASRLGLVSYGRNNVTYAPGPGSYFQLLGYLTDARLPLPNGWQPSEPVLLPTCQTCRACLDDCPTGAIDENRVLLHAERCLTFANENPGPWPPWVGPEAHHCLLGCLRCQRPCPENPELPVERTGVVFTRDETRALLAGSADHLGPVREGLRGKLDLLGQPGAEAVLGRNLRALVANREMTG
jgi:epoxyqueuosine reductase